MPSRAGSTRSRRRSTTRMRPCSTSRERRSSAESTSEQRHVRRGPPPPLTARSRSAARRRQIWETPVSIPHSTRGGQMHAVVVRVSISDRQAAERTLNEEVVPRVSQAPGFQAGYWTWKDNNGLSMVIFDSEDAANKAAEQVRAMIQDRPAVSLINEEVREVVAQA